MPTDPFVAPEADASPRQAPNLAPGVTLPAARGWRTGRPGDLVGPQPRGTQLGRPGPNIGYALRLVELRRASFVLAAHEVPADAVSVVAELAMKRAAAVGRAPTAVDVDVAARILGYTGAAAEPEFVAWRAHATHESAHDYHRRRAVVDALSDDALLGAAPSDADVAAVRAMLAPRASGR